MERRFPNLQYRRFPNRQHSAFPTARGFGNPRYSRTGSLRYERATGPADGVKCGLELLSERPFDRLLYCCARRTHWSPLYSALARGRIRSGSGDRPGRGGGGRDLWWCRGLWFDGDLDVFSRATDLAWDHWRCLPGLSWYSHICDAAE